MGYRNGNSTYYKSTVKKALEKYRPQTNLFNNRIDDWFNICYYN